MNKKVISGQNWMCKIDNEKWIFKHIKDGWEDYSRVYYDYELDCPKPLYRVTQYKKYTCKRKNIF